jgi:hypothetical protein
MAKRGRRSGADLVSIPLQPDIVQRPDSPYDLNDEESVEWWAIVNRMPADWFGRETHPMLTQLCRHTVSARRVSQLIAQIEKGETLDVREYGYLLGLRERETKAICALSTKMRLSHQATMPQRTQRPPQLPPAPWLRGDDR